MPDPASKQQEAEAAFKSILEDMVLIARKLAPYCTTVEAMVDMLELATINDGQLRLLLYGIKEKAK